MIFHENAKLLHFDRSRGNVPHIYLTNVHVVNNQSWSNLGWIVWMEDTAKI